MNTKHPLTILNRFLLHPFWRLTRGLTLGVRGVAVDSLGRVLLVRHTYYPGWHFPGGGVERDETVYSALSRELLEEAGVVVMGEPKLHGIFANFANFKSDHIAVFIVETWHQYDWKKSAEIADKRMFALDDLPENVTPGTRRRLAEIFEHARKAQSW